MIRAIIRFLVSAVVLLVVSWLVPGMSVAGFGGALIAALVIAVIGWLAEKLFGKDMSPQARGFTGFLIAAVVIYLAQFIVPNSIEVSIIGALLASLVIGLVDAFVPTTLR
ncbi:MAG: phage holin family protein [Peptococcia bacterium]